MEIPAHEYSEFNKPDALRMDGSEQITNGPGTGKVPLQITNGPGAGKAPLQITNEPHDPTKDPKRPSTQQVSAEVASPEISPEKVKEAENYSRSKDVEEQQVNQDSTHNQSFTNINVSSEHLASSEAFEEEEEERADKRARASADDGSKNVKKKEEDKPSSGGDYASNMMEAFNDAFKFGKQYNVWSAGYNALKNLSQGNTPNNTPQDNNRPENLPQATPVDPSVDPQTVEAQNARAFEEDRLATEEGEVIEAEAVEDGEVVHDNKGDENTINRKKDAGEDKPLPGSEYGEINDIDEGEYVSPTASGGEAKPIEMTPLKSTPKPGVGSSPVESTEMAKYDASRAEEKVVARKEEQQKARQEARQEEVQDKYPGMSGIDE